MLSIPVKGDLNLVTITFPCVFLAQVTPTSETKVRDEALRVFVVQSTWVGPQRKARLDNAANTEIVCAEFAYR